MTQKPPNASVNRGKEPLDRPLRIGWKEYLDFPEWGVRRVKVKIDTGARTSALGAISYDLVEAEGRGLIARLRLALRRKQPGRLTEVEVPVLRTVVVRNSGGMPELRPLLEVLVRLGPVSKRILVTVTHRSGMRFPMILGRRALEGDFLVDVSGKYLLRH
ncbi:MAG TPA: RimK/LysX family protein [Gemmataceae bacterium]|nr:RimK/LysX family protein [Gemmataceae bacterium]